MSRPVSNGEQALIRAEHLSGLPVPDTSEPADVQAWRSEHQAVSDPALYRAAADLKRAARTDLEADSEA